ncbi:hypothetical protein FACS1894199_04590 [Bacteroidia bacterium]|nr:hypothetical protein FACS1894199_04590 [Bacteroidia bacterium]
MNTIKDVKYYGICEDAKGNDLKGQSIIAIGDIHGLNYWQKVVKENPNSKYVFLGDYLDPNADMSHDLLIDNLQQIVQFKQEQPKNVVLLLGNHDLQYFLRGIDRCSRYDMFIAGKARPLFVENQSLFQYAHQEGNTIFTHAGIAHHWFVRDFKGDLTKNIADQLNNPTPIQETALYRCGECRGGEKDAVGGIFWADTEELDEPLQGYTQVVGHNKVNNVTVHIKNGGRIVFCDCLFNKRCLRYIL